MLPFHDQTDWVAEALGSLKGQQGVDLVVHVIDDASEDRRAADALLLAWSSSWRSVRPYRNRRRIGQYFSVNNVARRFETEFLAIQDGDDISTPRRIATSIDLLELHQADIVAGAMRLFGEAIAKPGEIRYSTHPRETGRPAHFIQNPTACLRTKVFLALGGYADLGHHNRCTNDNEFWWRAYYAGCKFVLSSDLFLFYRVHQDQATRHAETGMGTAIRRQSQTAVCERVELYRQIETFDPSRFGAMAAAAGVTQPWQENGHPDGSRNTPTD